jgi:hypothetical protein
MTSPVEPWQHDIGFESRVRRTIEPVVRPYGLALRQAGPNQVTYASDRLWLEVGHEPSDGEVSIYFGRLDHAERHSFTLYLRWRAPEEPAAKVDGVAWTGDEVQSVLEGLAAGLQAAGEPVLSGEADIFERMKDVRWWQSMPEVVVDPLRDEL